jgi:hypothetical protein
MDTTSQARLNITKLHNSILVLKQLDGQDFFVAAPNSIVIPISKLTLILHFLVKNNMINHEILEGILEEYHSDTGKGNFSSKENSSDIGIG